MPSTPLVQKGVDLIRDRISGVENDLKCFVFIRANKLEHTQPNNLGGGNIVAALALFSILNLLGKAYYVTVRPDKFSFEKNSDEPKVNEEEVFIALMKFVFAQGVDLGLGVNGTSLKIVWTGFRNYLAHLLVVEDGKSVMNFTYRGFEGQSVNYALKKAKESKVFEHDGSFKNWVVRTDTLLAWIPDITELVCNFLIDTPSVDEELLRKVVRF